ncbi:PocR ligand-binding domain-containing protein [Cerasicoccus fimbriatus]|uniref:PocR ligand-binding domain-containing protein n=1 Tax=Cerasicoccus fimbriatus TaxID=3014554 RepID=UPI0022B4A982|nr:PocR ligand-binding domain-containing protein [Cerasicoccus sp. TK19100]
MKLANNLDKPQAAGDPASERSRQATALLEETQIFKDYQKAFRKATGLPLGIRPIQSYENALSGQADENEFCKLMGRTNVGCANCLKMQEQLEQEAGLEPKSLHCFAGLCDTAVPIRVGDQLIAFLQTGQILLHQPNEQEFSQTTKQILKWGSEVNLKHLQEAYFNTKVLDRGQYEAMIALLSTFAEHLATISNSIAVEESDADPMLVANAKKYIQDRYQEQLSLDDAAKAVNASTRHFCKVFKQATGITFTDYLARVRVEKAKTMLTNLNLRVSEIAFEVGFDSISQFNRSFKRVAGHTPTEYRRLKARAG